MRRTHRIAALLTLIGGAGLACSASAAFRCGAEEISLGSSALKVLTECGEPVVGDPERLDRAQWVFNFGPEAFMVRVTIENGVVAQIDTLDRGFEVGSEVPEALTEEAPAARP